MCQLGVDVGLEEVEERVTGPTSLVPLGEEERVLAGCGDDEHVAKLGRGRVILSELVQGLVVPCVPHGAACAELAVAEVEFEVGGARRLLFECQMVLLLVLRHRRAFEPVSGVTRGVQQAETSAVDAGDLYSGVWLAGLRDLQPVRGKRMAGHPLSNSDDSMSRALGV